MPCSIRMWSLTRSKLSHNAHTHTTPLEMQLQRMSQCVIDVNSYLMPLPTSPFVVSPLWNFFRSPGQYHFTVRGGNSCSDPHSMWNHCPKSHCKNHQYNA